MRTLVGRRLLPILVVVAALLLPVAAGAQSILVTAQETADGSLLPPPNAAVEGTEAALYDAGFIVFEGALPGSGGRPAELAKMAREGGTDLLLVLHVEYVSGALSGGSTGTTGHAAWSLLDPATSAELAEGTEDTSNKGREKTVDRGSLGQELGRTIAARVAAAIAALPARR